MQGFKGEVEFSNQVPWRKKGYSPGIMGPFSFMPFMECYHGILSMDHSIKGSLTIDGEEIDFNNGRLHGKGLGTLVPYCLFLDAIQSF
jgi:tocopherol cyclase